MRKLKTVVSMLSLFVFVVCFFALIVVMNVSYFFSEDSMEDNLNNIDIIHEMEKIQNSSATTESKAEIADIINTVYEEAESHNISTDLVDTIFNSKEVKTFLGSAVGSTTDYIINGEEAETVTSEEFNQILDDNIDKWVEESGIELSDSMKEVLLIRMKSASASIIDNLPSALTIEESLDESIIEEVQLVFSDYTKMVLLVISVVMLLIVWILKFKDKVFIKYMAVAFGIDGLLTISISFIVDDIISYALTSYGINFLVSTISASLSSNILISGVVVLIISVVMFVIYKLLTRGKVLNA